MTFTSTLTTTSTSTTTPTRFVTSGGRAVTGFSGVGLPAETHSQKRPQVAADSHSAASVTVLADVHLARWTESRVFRREGIAAARADVLDPRSRADDEQRDEHEHADEPAGQAEKGREDDRKQNAHRLDQAADAGVLDLLDGLCHGLVFRSRCATGWPIIARSREVAA